jgi:hypothetical protein
VLGEQISLLFAGTPSVVARRRQREVPPFDGTVEEDRTDPGVCYAKNLEQVPL